MIFFFSEGAVHGRATEQSFSGETALGSFWVIKQDLLSLSQVAGAIVKSGGNQIQVESDEYVTKYGPVKTGGIAVTGPGNLPCKIVIHTVGKNLLVETGLPRQPTQLVSLRFTCNQSWSNIKKEEEKYVQSCSKSAQSC